jgi:hypothetical protein
MILKDEVECNWQLLLPAPMAGHPLHPECHTGAPGHCRTRYNQRVWQNHPQMAVDT